MLTCKRKADLAVEDYCTNCKHPSWKKQCKRKMYHEQEENKKLEGEVPAKRILKQVDYFQPDNFYKRQLPEIPSRHGKDQLLDFSVDKLANF